MFLLMRDINALLDMYMVAASFFYGLCMLALIVLRFTKKDAERTFKVSIAKFLSRTICSLQARNLVKIQSVPENAPVKEELITSPTGVLRQLVHTIVASGHYGWCLGYL